MNHFTRHVEFKFSFPFMNCDVYMYTANGMYIYPSKKSVIAFLKESLFTTVATYRTHE